VDIFQKRKIRNDGSWERKKKKEVFPKKVSVVARACACVDKALGSFFFGLEEEER
jgi:hypothetical protein